MGDISALSAWFWEQWELFSSPIAGFPFFALGAI